MNRCKNKRWMALVASVVLLANLLVLAIPIYADSDLPYESSYVIKVEYKRSKQDNKYYNLIVTFIADTDIYASGIQASLGSCTLLPKEKDDIFAYQKDIKYANPDGERGTSQDVFKVEFDPVYDAKSGNNLVFSILHWPRDEHGAIIDGEPPKKEYITYDMSTILGRDNDGTGSSSETPDDDTPIAALKPHLIVDSYSYGEASAGKDVPVTFTLKNTSASKTIRNVVLTVKASGDLRIKSASDTIYVDSIQPGKTITKSMNFFLGAGTQADVQDIAISSTFEYFDIEGQNAVSGGDSITISIPTDTVERVRIQKVDLPDMLYPGTEEEIAYSVVNAGFSTLYNCEIKVVDEEGTEYAYAYVGSLEPSKAASQPYLPIMFDVSGEKNLKFMLTYENEKLQAGEVTRDFTVSVMEMPIYEEPPFNPMPEEPMPEEPQGMAPWLLWVIIGGGVLVAVIVTVVVIKAVKKKRSELDDEDI